MSDIRFLKCIHNDLLIVEICLVDQ